MDPLPRRFTQTIASQFGAAGDAWLAALPWLIAECEHRWALAVDRPFPNLSINYVAPATCADGTAAVLKLGMPGPELRTEIAALRIYDGRGSARLLAADENQGAILLERLQPGRSLATVTDDQHATSLAAGVMRDLWRQLPLDHPFPSVSDWAADLDDLPRVFDGGTGPLPPALVDMARGLFAELIGSMGPPVLLHGDLHHMNILAARGGQWVAIDPKGVAGEREYEVGALMRNPVPHFLDVPNPARMLARRLDQLGEELSFDRERLRGWSLAQAVLAAWWGVEDRSGGWRCWIRCAELLAQV